MSNYCQALLEKLIREESVTPGDANCQAILAEELKKLGFTVQHLPCDPVQNLWAVIGEGAPLLVFAGHTDVVATGELSQWDTPPFTPTVKDGVLFGRGAADMKGSLAAMFDAARNFLSNNPSFNGSLGFLITSGEEGDQFDKGTPFVMEALNNKGVHIDYCIVGEPSSTSQLGDIIKIGRRGSLTGKVTILGKQGHVAYPHLAENPIHLCAGALNDLCYHRWDEGNQYFPPTTFQISNIRAGTGAGNVIPGECFFQFNFRFSTESSPQSLKATVDATLNKHDLPHQISWRTNGMPFITQPGVLIDACSDAIKSICGCTPELSTSGGTSDARFIAPYGTEVIELGPINATIHQINECVSLSDLFQLSTIYEHICSDVLGSVNSNK